MMDAIDYLLFVLMAGYTISLIADIHKGIVLFGGTLSFILAYPMIRTFFTGE